MSELGSSPAAVEVSEAFWKGKRVMLTGHTGFKGSWLTLWLWRLGAKVLGFAKAPDTSPSMFQALELSSLCEHRLGEIRSPEEVRSALLTFQPQIVIHMAAQALVRRGYADPLETFGVNVQGTANLLDACRQCEALRVVVVVTSDKCYKNREWPYPYREADRLGGRDPYSASKACAELVTEAFRRSFFEEGAERAGQAIVASARSGNVIGGGDWGEDRLAPDAARAFSEDRPLIVRNPGAVRPWQHVLEPLHGYLRLARACHEQGKAFAGAWNFGPLPNQFLTVRELADCFRREWGGQARVQFGEGGPAFHEANLLLLDSTLARRRLGWNSKLDLASVVAQAAAWYKSYYGGASAEALRRLTLEQIADALSKGNGE